MNRVDTSDEFRRSGRSLVSDHPAHFAPVEDEIAHLDFTHDDPAPEGLAVWNARTTAGLTVQGLVDGDGRTYITAGIATRSLWQTWEVPVAQAADAFLHPFAYGCTLPL